MGGFAAIFERAGFLFGAGYHGGNDGNEYICYFGVGGKIWAAGGNDTVSGGLAYVNIDKSWGDLGVYGAFGHVGVNKWGEGNINVAGAIGYAAITHSGWWGDLNVWGATGGVNARRYGNSGNINMSGTTGYAELRNYTNAGSVSFSGAAVGVYLERGGGNWGNVSFWGSAGYVNIVNSANFGDVNIYGATGGVNARRYGGSGNINMVSTTGYAELRNFTNEGSVAFSGVAAGVYLERSGGNRGDVFFGGSAGYANIVNSANFGDINIYGATGGVNARRYGGSGNINMVGTTGYAELRNFANQGSVTFNGVAAGVYLERSGGNGGNVYFGGSAGYANIVNSATFGDINIYGSTGGVNARRYGGSGNINMVGTTGYAELRNFTNEGSVAFSGVAAGVYLERSGGNRGDVFFGGSAGYANIVNSANFGYVNIYGTTGGVNAKRHGVFGDIYMGGTTGNAELRNFTNEGSVTFSGVAAKVNLERSGGNRGNVNFWGSAGYVNIINTATFGDVNLGGGIGGFVIHRRGTSGNVNVHSAAAYGRIEHYATNGDVNYHGAGAYTQIHRSGYDGNVNHYGAGVGVNIQHNATYGDVNFYGVAVATVINRSGYWGNVRLVGAGAANVVTMTVRQGNLEVHALGGANVVQRTGAGYTQAYMAGGANVLINKGSGYTAAKLFGAYNHVEAGDGGSSIESYGIGATIITGRGVDNIKSYGLSSVIKSGGAPDGQKDHVEAYGAFTHVDLTGGIADKGAAGRTSAAESFQRVMSIAPIARTTSMVSTDLIEISDSDQETMVAYGMGDDGAQAISESNVSALGVEQTETQGVTSEQREMLSQSGRSIDETRLYATAKPDAESYKKYVPKEAVEEKVEVKVEALKTVVADEEFEYFSSNNVAPTTQKRSSVPSVTAQPAQGQISNEQKNTISYSSTAGALHYDDRVDLVGLASVASTGNNNDRVHAVSLYNEIHTNGGDDFVLALGAVNNIWTGSGNDTAVIMGFGNFADMGDGDDVAVMLNPIALVPGGSIIPSVNVAQMGRGDDIVVALSHLNIVLKDGDGDLKAFMFGLGNIVNQQGGRVGDQMLVVTGGLLNVAHKEGDGDVLAITLGVASSVSQKGNGNFMAIMGGVLNVASHVGDGEYQAYMLGVGNISSKDGDGFSRVAMLGALNVHTGVGDGDAQFYMGGAFNLATKVGNGKVSALMVSGGNVLTVLGNGDLEGVFLAGGNIITKIGNGNSAMLMGGFGGIYTNTGKGHMTVVAVGQGNIITKVGHGEVYLLNVAVPLSALLGSPEVPTANVFTQVGDGNVMGIMVAMSSKVAGNVFTKVGNGDVAMAMIAATPDSLNSVKNEGAQPLTLNMATQVGNGRTYALMFGGLNVFTKVGSGNYTDGWNKFDDSKIDSLFDDGERSVADAVNGGMRNIAKGMSPLLANRALHTIMGAFGSANIMLEESHGSALESTTNTVMAGIGGYGNAMAKIGNGDFYGFAVANPTEISKYFGSKTKPKPLDGDPLDGESLAILFSENDAKQTSEINGNIIVHVGRGDTNALAIGGTNIMVKVGDGGMKAIALGDNNIIVRVGDAAGTKQAVDIGGYQAFEGTQLVFGDRNIVVNQGKSNDVIVALDPNMLLNGDSWEKIGKSMNPFPSLFKSEADKQKEEKDGKDVSDIFGRKFNSKTDPDGYHGVQNRNTFGLQGAIGAYTLFIEGPGSYWNELKEKRIKDNESAKNKGVATPDPYGNFVYGGEGSDIILAVGTNNIVLSDSWSSLLDFNLEMLYDAGGKNKTLSSLGSKLGTFGDMVGSRSIGLSNIPVIGPVLGKLGVSGGFKWLPRKDLGSLTGLDGDANGDVQFDGSDVGREWANAGLGAPNWEFAMPQIWTSVAGTFVNIYKIIGGANLTHSGEGYTSDQGKDFSSGWKSGIGEFVSVIGVPELLSSLHVTDDKGRNVWQRFFDRDTTVGWGSMWKDPASFWSGVNLLQNNGDIVAAIGMNNVVFTGEGGDMAFTLGSYNSVALGDGRDISLSWGEDNRVAGGDDNDFLIGVGSSNLLIGGNGNDLVVALGEKNRITGDGGDDMLVAIGLSNTMLSGAGDDFIVAVGKNNYVSAGGGDDLIIGIGVNNVYNVGGGNDVIINYGFASQTYFGDGSDIAYARGMGNYLDGEAGADILYSDAEGSLNRLEGGDGDDTLYLGGRDNEFYGGSDNDTFVVRDVVETNTVKDLSSADRIVIDGSVKVDDIWLSRDSSDLLLAIDRWDQGADGVEPSVKVGEVRFSNWFESSSNQAKLYFNQEKTPSGDAAPTAKSLSASEVNSLVNAMASFVRADASGGFRDNMDAAAKTNVTSLWAAASKVDSFTVASV